MKSSNNSLELFWTLAVTDFKLRYHGSYLGYVWTLLKPLALFGVLYVVFSVFINIQIQHYQLFLLLGIILWNYFAEATQIGVSSLASKSGILKKIYFPRILIVLASNASSFLGLFFNLCIFFLFSVLAGVFPSLLGIVLFFVLIVILFFLTLGLSLLLSGLYIVAKDTNQVWEVLLQMGFWLTPIVYTIAIVPAAYHQVLFINPMTGIIQYARALLIEGTLPSLMGIGYLVACTALVMIVGWFVFKRLEYLAPEKL